MLHRRAGSNPRFFAPYYNPKNFKDFGFTPFLRARTRNIKYRYTIYIIIYNIFSTAYFSVSFGSPELDRGCAEGGDQALPSPLSSALAFPLCSSSFLILSFWLLFLSVFFLLLFSRFLSRLLSFSIFRWFFVFGTRLFGGCFLFLRG
nr:MAG TPA_asm: hypothetical protein [Caudoviricetes sp.]